MICFYHNDADGRCAGAIVRKYVQENFPDTKQRYVEIDYAYQDIALSQVEEGETVYVVDFHFTAEITTEMQKIASRIVVFDHHKTSAEVTAEYPESVECHCDPGSNYSGCELVWNHLFPVDSMPMAVRLIGDRDAWKWQYGKETARFNAGLKLYPHQPMDKIWYELLDDEGNFDVITNIMVKGEICLRYRDAMCKEFRDFWGFEAEIEGYKCYVMNLILSGITTEMFAEKLEEYDVCVGMVYKNGTWKISLRSNGKVDVSELAKKFPGGGGHKTCAGAEGLIELPFKRIEHES